MARPIPPYGIGQAIISSSCGFFFSFFFLSFFPGLFSAVAHWMTCLLYFHAWCGLSANLRCRSVTCCTRLTENTGRKKSPKIRHLGTIAQLCQAIPSQLKHLLTTGKKLVKQQYLPHISTQYGKLRPTSGWDRFASLGHPSKFQRVSRLGSVTAGQSSTGRQPNFAALRRGRHLYSAGQPSRWPSSAF